MNKELNEQKREMLKNLFQSIADHADAYQLLINAQAPKKLVFQFDEKCLLNKLQKNDSPLEMYHAVAIEKSLGEIILLWFKNGMQETAEEMAEIMLKIFFINN